MLAFLLLSNRPFDFGAVTEAEHNPLFGINGQGVDHGVPQAVIEGGHQILCPAQFFQINLDAFPLCSPLGKILLQGVVLGFGCFIPLDQGIVLLCVHFRLNGNVGIFLYALSDQLGGNRTFFSQGIHFSLDSCRIADGFQGFLAPGNDLFFIGDAGVECSEESLFDFSLGDVRGTAGCRALTLLVFVVAGPNHPAVLIIRIPYLAAEYAAALTADDSAGKNARGTVPSSQLLATLDLMLNQIEYFRRNDGIVAACDIVL